jgi:hypothetical protein
MTRRECPASWRPTCRVPESGCCEACAQPATMAVEVQFGGTGAETYRACAPCGRRAADNVRTFLRVCGERAAAEREAA